ncbi:MAG: hypothetical protein MJ102_09870, partial [Clostridia bacterium]|nr:hypothetical protein [Clostridia bacterium]
MKKALTILLTAVMLLGLFAQTVMAADTAPKFTEKFFSSGKADAPADIYLEIKKDDSGRAGRIYVWLTQPDDVVTAFSEYSYLGSDSFKETYGCDIVDNRIQIDCKVDDGPWHYMPEWDKDEYPQEDQPYDLAIRQKIVAQMDQKTYREGGALLDPGCGRDDENAGYLKPVIYTKDNDWYFDLDNHTLTIRMRYIITYENTDYERDYILSDWSDEIAIGKNATQKELVYPETLEAPAISELTFVESVERGEGNSDTTWKVYVNYPKSNGDADKYYSVVMDSFEPLCAVMQYRVKSGDEWGEWKNTYWGNPTWISSGWKTFTTEGVSKDDAIEFRTSIKNNAEAGKDSPYSVSLFCNAGDSHKEEPDSSGTP